ncbi:MAG: 30S ribosomal protein S7 [candidate division Zixibacteria bacterium]|nr:30S ribosomal protein S7 [candidate division Zixibacteria bacterium]MBU1471445.1 30S ribosomal protein S7 [candidate division Zixibacteria bacterium]MBU2624116.1 30S ribosomal protein S7 [candidate division Zixibacteria bacterium]
MARRKKIQKRQRPPDSVYGDTMVTYFIHNLMMEGRKSTAERLFYDALEIVEQKTNQKGLDIFHKALSNVKPVLEVKSRRVGGATYQVPIEVRPNRRNALAIRWLIGYSRSRSEHSMAEKLAGEFMAAAKNEGASIKKREDTHRMAEANKAFAHFRW